MQRLFTLLVLLSLPALVFGKQIDENTAKSIGQNFLKARTNSQAFRAISTLELAYKASSRIVSVQDAENPINYFYVFNSGPGFVIVSADDNVTPILGYSTESNFDPAKISPTTQEWLDGYKKEINYVIENHLPATVQIQNAWEELKDNNNKRFIPATTSSVNALCQTRWNQSPYYNAQCPMDATAGSRCVTGCVATAMAQIMKYWNYPTTGTGSNSYTHPTYGTLSANFAGTTYSWSAMPNTLSGNNSAVATLMYHCGVAVEMNYGPNGSSAYMLMYSLSYTNSAEYSYKGYFGYDASTLKGKRRANYTDANWTALLKTELDAGRPVQYAGFNPSSGHSFVCDGYDINNMFHFNWGWGGYADGNFVINSLNPGGYTYNNDHEAIVGIQPPATSQIITFNTIPTKLYGVADFSPGATASSGLQVSYTSSNPAVATIVNGMIHVVGVGTSTITASQPGGLQYPAATPVSRTLTVNKANQTITCTISSKTIGDADFDPGATASSGLTPINYASSNTSVASIVNGKIHITGGGTAIITISQAGNSNYNSISLNKTLTVNKLSNTITFPALAAKLITDAPFATNVSVTNGTLTYTSSNTAVATINATGTITIVGAGTSTITASQAGSATYNAVSMSKTLTVSKLTNTMTFATIAPKLITDAPFATNVTVTNGAITYSSSNNAVATINASGTITLVAAGNATITATQAGSAIYKPVSMSKSLTVSKLANTITFPAITGKFVNSAAFATNASVTNGTLTYSTSNAAVATVNASGLVTIVGDGTVSITASQAGSATYKSATLSRSFTVSKLTQTLTFNGIVNKTTSSADFTVTATSSAGLSTTLSVVSGPATISGNTVHLTGATGTVKLRATQAGNATYKSVTLDKTFTVTTSSLRQGPAKDDVATVNQSETPGSNERLTSNEMYHDNSIESVSVGLTTNIYPNPTTGPLHLVNTELIKELFILDITGKVIIHEIFQAPLNSYNVDLSALQKGIYFARVSTLQKTEVISIVVK